MHFPTIQLIFLIDTLVGLGALFDDWNGDYRSVGHDDKLLLNAAASHRTCSVTKPVNAPSNSCKWLRSATSFRKSNESIQFPNLFAAAVSCSRRSSSRHWIEEKAFASNASMTATLLALAFSRSASPIRRDFRSESRTRIGSNWHDRRWQLIDYSRNWQIISRQASKTADLPFAKLDLLLGALQILFHQHQLSGNLHAKSAANFFVLFSFLLTANNKNPREVSKESKKVELVQQTTTS